MGCIKCGSEEHCEYGSDGHMYCESCRFYGMNQQCWRCRIYVPFAEMQQYRGFWMCQYCLIDAREEKIKRDEKMRVEQAVAAELEIERAKTLSPGLERLPFAPYEVEKRDPISGISRALRRGIKNILGAAYFSMVHREKQGSVQEDLKE